MIDYDAIKEKAIQVLKTIYDPEIPVNIYELGLIYDIVVFLENRAVICHITMTLTSAACPVAESLYEQVSSINSIVNEIDEMRVDLVFDPPWDPDNLSFDAKLTLGML